MMLLRCATAALLAPKLCKMTAQVSG